MKHWHEFFFGFVHILKKLIAWLDAPPRWWEPSVWCVITALAILPRVLMYVAVPSALLSDDSNSYLAPAIEILNGNYEIESHRGWGYVFFLIPLAAYPQIFFPLVAIVQQSISGFTVLGTLVFLRLLLGVKSLIWLLLISWGASFYAVPIFLAHLIRNETPHALFTMLGFGFLGLGLQRNSLRCCILSGVFLALMNMVKATLPLAPFFSAIAFLWVARKQGLAWLKTASFLGVYFAVFLFPSWISVFPGVQFSSLSYAGQELFSQVAHLGFVESKKYPELTLALRPKWEVYLSMNKRDNGYARKNINNTVIGIISQSPQKYPKVDQVFKTLAWEVILSHPDKALADFWKRFVELNLQTGFRTKRPHIKHIRDAGENARSDAESQLYKGFNFEPALAQENAQENKALKLLKKISARVFPWEWVPPVLMTTLFCVFLPFCLKGPLRLWVVQIGLSWFFFLLLHSTVGEPKDRFYVPVFCLSIFLLGIALEKLSDFVGEVLGRLNHKASQQMN